MQTRFPRCLKFAPAGKNVRKSGSYCTNINRLNYGGQDVFVCIYAGLYKKVCVYVCMYVCKEESIFMATNYTD
jgi:hypothetical protein